MSEPTRPSDGDEDDAAGPDVAGAEPERAHGVVVSYSRGQRVLHPDRGQLREVVAALAEEGYEQLVDLTATDYLTADRQRPLPEGIEHERFELVVTLLSHRHRERVRLRTQVPEHDPTVPSLFDLHPGSELLEREVFDMFGLRFEDHPDMTRVLMPEDWVGHPLRKDFSVGRIPVQFKGAPSQR